ncbi:N-acyl-D-amino-acid deacylase family protein [Sphingomonas profundi]|uniref:N-acyl-D-amino-acid deacylase family protein n=1 Tax=Alterirhizorhabdus profundi TaxID=2681549 RepID=UPI0012E75C47|nr:amidohydrolase family protein [Sphingomonas profundi]
MYDLVIRGGRIIDGTGLPAFHADLAIKGGRIARIGRVGASTGAREIDARGKIVTPGFIDGHTHYDAQLNWDPYLTNSSTHGVTSVVMGNCGFSIAPVRPGEKAMVTRNLERAEDISAEAMELGVDWSWEHFTEYMERVDALPKALNCAVNVGHSALRTWAMGTRAFTETASDDELALMREELRAAIRAGAIGFTTSRTENHQTADDRPVASRLAAWSEVEALVDVLGEEKSGIFELAVEDEMRSNDAAARTESIDRLAALTIRTGVPLTFGMHLGSFHSVDTIPEVLDRVSAMNDAGGRVFVQSHSKGITVLLSFETRLPFDRLPAWQALRAKPLAEQAFMLRDPAVRRDLIAAIDAASFERTVGADARPPEWDRIFVYDRALPPFRSLAELAAERKQHPVEVMIEIALEHDLRIFFMQFFHPPAPAIAMQVMRHPHAIMTFSDSGAHVSQISDSSIQTHLLAYWTRSVGAFGLEEAVRMVTLAPARAWGFTDRGQLREGAAADINVIDLERLLPQIPALAHDLPGGGPRLVQACAGMVATVVNGEVILEDGVPTGALPGKLLRAATAVAAG